MPEPKPSLFLIEIHTEFGVFAFPTTAEQFDMAVSDPERLKALLTRGIEDGFAKIAEQNALGLAINPEMN